MRYSVAVAKKVVVCGCAKNVRFTHTHCIFPFHIHFGLKGQFIINEIIVVCIVNNLRYYFETGLVI